MLLFPFAPILLHLRTVPMLEKVRGRNTNPLLSLSMPAAVTLPFFCPVLTKYSGPGHISDGSALTLPSAQCAAALLAFSAVASTLRKELETLHARNGSLYPIIPSTTRHTLSTIQEGTGGFLLVVSCGFEPSACRSSVDCCQTWMELGLSRQIRVFLSN